jgi:ketosteroid isomerase-like protein
MHPNELLVRTCLIATSHGDAQTLTLKFADRIAFHFPGYSRFAGDYFGKPAVLRFWAAQYTLMGDITDQMTINDIHVEGEQVLALISVQSRIKEQSLLWHGYDLLYVHFGQIKEWWRHFEDQQAFDEFWMYRAPDIAFTEG